VHRDHTPSSGETMIEVLTAITILGIISSSIFLTIQVAEKMRIRNTKAGEAAFLCSSTADMLLVRYLDEYPITDTTFMASLGLHSYGVHVTGTQVTKDLTAIEIKVEDSKHDSIFATTLYQ
jgi:hypothetical protein